MGGTGLEMIESYNESALRVFGRPFAELKRGDQRMITKVAEARVKEMLEKRVALAREAALDTALDAHEQLEKMNQLENECLGLIDTLARNVKEMIAGGDADAGTTFNSKTADGAMKRNLRAVEKLIKIKKDHTDSLVSKAKLAEQKFTLVQNNDNRQQEAVVVTPDEVKARLGKFKSGGEG